MADRVEIELPSAFSDGNSNRWPAGAEYVWDQDDKLYVEKLADLARDVIQGCKDGQKYVFKDLPSGYRTFSKLRKDGKIKDRYVFGHPSGRFDSPNKFSVHFKWLMQGGTGSCKCVNCHPQIMRHSSLTGATPSLTFEPCIYDLTSQIKRYVSYFKEATDERHFMLWEGATYQPARNFLGGQSFETVVAKYQTTPSFVPRKGELVLFTIDKELDFRFEMSTQHFKLFDKTSDKILGPPTWRAGVVAADTDQFFSLEDLTTPSSHGSTLVEKHFRIELYPDPQSRDKSLSNQVYHVPLHRIRPLSVFHELLSGIAQVDWHETINNALKSLNTACLVDPVGIIGTWFTYSVTCRGVWIGPELYVKGDAVRLLPANEDGNEVDQVIIISRIDHRFEDNAVQADRSSIVLAGPVFTSNKKKSGRDTPFTTTEMENLKCPTSMRGYTWYPARVSSEGNSLGDNYGSGFENWREVPLSFIVGRLHDSEAMKLLVGVGDFDIGGLGRKQARKWAKRHQKIEVENHQGWILALDRIEALDINTLNGRAVRNGAGGQNYGDKSQISKASETSETDDNAPSDINGMSSRSLKSIVTDPCYDYSDDEDEDERAHRLVSGLIIEKGFPAEGSILGTDDQDGSQVAESSERDRPMKRTRI